MPNILFRGVDLKTMVDEPILEAEHMDPSYSDHATDVYRVRTQSGKLALRMFSSGEECNGPFWDGLKWLFGWKLQVSADVAARHRLLREAGGLAVPEVMGNGHAGALEYLVMEWMHCIHCNSFAELTPSGLHAFGLSLARMHSRTFSHEGLLPLPEEATRQEFPGRLQWALERLVETYYPDRADLNGALMEMVNRAAAIRLDAFSPVMIDINASQYLRLPDGQICALVDTDAYVAGPRELDFFNLEYVLTADKAAAFAVGYEEVLPLPDLADVRPIYRYLCLVLEVQGTKPL